MSCYSITYRDRRKMAVPVTKEEYLQIRDSSRNIANLTLARKGSQPAKRSLVQFCYSCYPNQDGTLKGATMPSRTVAMDIDHVEKPAELAQKIAARADELDIYMIENTAGGHGLHVVFRRNPELTNEQNIMHMAEALGVEADENAKDITRVLFTTTASPNELFLLRDELFADNGEDVAAGIMATKGNAVDTKAVRDDYKGIPYATIIDTWWKLHYNGETPSQSNRNTQIFELAVNLRHICGYSEAQLRHIIPCYDGFSEEERNQCIASAVATRRTMMPRRMTEVLNYIKKQNVSDVTMLADIEKAVADGFTYYDDQLPPLPIGLEESVRQASSGLAIPAIFAVGTIAGFLATNVQVAVHGVRRGLSLQSFIVGESGSGKSSCTRIFKAWTKLMQEDIDEYYQKEESWARKNRNKKSGKVDDEPEGKVRIIVLNTTSANVSERLNNVKGTHSISYVSEADVVFGKWRGDMETLTSLLRTAYDEDRYDREAKSLEAARCHIPSLKWNTLMCGTPDALYRLVTNVTDGFMNRMCIARTPDNTFAPYVIGSEVGFSEGDEQRINFCVQCLKLMRGVLDNEMLEQWNLEWVETMRIEALKQGADRVLARMRLRTSNTSARMTVASYVLLRAIEKMLEQYGTQERVINALTDNPECWIPFAQCCVDEDTHQFYNLITDYLVDQYLLYFEDDLREAYDDTKYNRQNTGSTRRRKICLYDELPAEFNADDILSVYEKLNGKSLARVSAFNMISKWKQQGMITDGNARFHYIKCNNDNGDDIAQ